MTDPRGTPPAGPLPDVVVAGPFTWHGTTVRAAPGHVYTRGGDGIDPVGAMCHACCEAIINAGDHRGGWTGRPLYRGEDGEWGCEGCGVGIA